MKVKITNDEMLTGTTLDLCSYVDLQTLMDILARADNKIRIETTLGGEANENFEVDDDF